MKTTARLLSVIALTATFAVACGDDGTGTGTAPVGGGGSSGSGGTSGGTFAGSCQNAPAGFCNEFTGSGYTPAKTQSDCEALGAGIQYLSGHCPTDGRVGTCLVYAGKASESYYRYYATFPGTPGATAESAAAGAERQCNDTLKGQWTPN